ncbi:MAG: ABC transporter ATP-binding protein [Myxococcota bacterium]
MKALFIHGLTKRFGDFTAVDRVDLSVEPGEIFALLGPNGAGKTTLISCVSGLVEPDAGTIQVFGHDVVRDFRTTRRLVGLVPQEVNFDPFFTPHESLMIQMGLMGQRPDPQWADDLLRTFALEHRRDAYTRTLSGGMKRRLLLAKALVHRPRLLFLDEPTAGVDVELRRDLWREVRALRAGGTTIILTTHYLEEAEELSDRVGVLRNGSLVLVEPREQLMDRHRQSRLTIQLDCDVETVPADIEGGQLTDPRTLVVTWHRPEDLERTIAQVRHHFPIRDVKIHQTTLEDIFLDLVQSEKASA